MHTKKKLKLGISACLLGEKVRYDGGHKLDRFITETLGLQFELLPFCPEVECGLPVPREAMQLVGDSGSPRVITIETRIDRTEQVLRWVETGLYTIDEQHICGYVFKARSPSCGVCDAEIVAPSGGLTEKGPGLFARAVMQRFPLLPVIDEEGLAVPEARNGFLERVRG
ncbi:MAG TPA: DUF523 domain-containing protein [Nitrospirota bacterium]|nr:DUF523 domain-containing protein [Nitrospirota bacterium]